MKKAIITLSLLAMATSIMAGGIIHNTNQSASFIRMPARDAIFGIDGVYYNPAGLTKLRDGFHFSLSNQYITQTRNIKSTFPGMNRNEFEGGVVAPLFPSFYAVYKMDKLAFSVGFNPIGGGGSALFEEGLPSFEMAPSSIPASLTASGITTTKYSLETEFEGKSTYYGFQGGVTYQPHEKVSFSVGARYVTISNSYAGYLKNISINPLHPLNPDGGMIKATTFFSSLSTAATNAAASVDPLVTNPATQSLTLDQLVSYGIIDNATAAQLQGGLGANYNPAMSITTIQGAYSMIAIQTSSNALLTDDKEVDATQSGSGIVPIIGVNFNFSDKCNIAVKYEFKAKIDVKNKTEVDDVGMYPNDSLVPNDIPAMLTVGIQYAILENLTFHAGIHYYFDRQVKYGKKVNNEYVVNSALMGEDFKEYALGFEYILNDKWLISSGYLRTQTGVNENYHSDLSHSLSTHSINGGIRYSFNENMSLNAGIMRTWYDEDKRDFSGYTETYNRKAAVIAVGLDVSL